MKHVLTLIAVVMGIALGIHFGSSVHAQSAVPFSFATTAATHASCPTVAASTSQYCFAADGFWQSLNGAAYLQIGPSAAGVTSFNGRTGAVVSATGDYSYSQLSTPPTNLSCPVFSLTTSGSTSGTSGSATGTCALK